MVFIFSIIQVVYATTMDGDCPSFHQEVRLSKDSLWVGDVPAMEKSLQSAHAGLECAKTLSVDTVRGDLGDFFLLNAYSAHLSGQDTDRTRWLQQSYNLGHWNSNFGPEIQALLNELATVKSISVSVLPIVDVELTFLVDCVFTDALDMSQGLHWIEIYHQDGLLNAQLMNVQEGSFIQLPDTESFSQPDVSSTKRVTGWLASAVFFSSMALSAHTVAMINHQQYGESTSLIQLEEQRLRTWRWGQASVVSGVLTLGCLGRWAVQQRRSSTTISVDNNSNTLE